MSVHGTDPVHARPALRERLAHGLAPGLVLFGMVNAMPGIPGLDDLARKITGNPLFRIRKYPFEIYDPLVFVRMMGIVVLRHSMYHDWQDRAPLRRRFGPVTNVLSTGVLTIPMRLERGFSRVFAGGVEAAASSGGSIMPPVMGGTAFVLAAMTAVPYGQVIVAAGEGARCGAGRLSLLRGQGICPLRARLLSGRLRR